jgi:hypothetical protein
VQVHDNPQVSGYPWEGIRASSFYNGQIRSNYVYNNGWLGSYDFGGIDIDTSFSTGGCDGAARDTNGLTVSANTSTGQPFGILLYDQYVATRATLSGVTITSDNMLGSNSLGQVGEDVAIVFNGYSAFSFVANPTSNPLTVGPYSGQRFMGASALFSARHSTRHIHIRRSGEYRLRQHRLHRRRIQHCGQR